MIERLLPPHVAAVALHGDAIGVTPLPEERALVAGAVEARIAEFATARHCAREALSRIGVAAGPILRGPKREPLWPAGVVGSITHCTGYRAAAVARTTDVLALGIDAEPHAAVPDGVLRRVLSDDERAAIAKMPTETHWSRLIFSVKESVYKAWFPLARRWLGFDEANVTIDPEASTFNARLLVEPPAGIPAAFDGRYLIEDGLVLTAIAVLRQA